MIFTISLKLFSCKCKKLKDENTLGHHKCQEGNVKCEYCDQTFVSKKKRANHIFEKPCHLKQERFVEPPFCSVCEKLFCNTKYLRKHQWKAHQDITKEEEVLCGYCFGFYKEAFLSYHINLKHFKIKSEQTLPKNKDGNIHNKEIAHQLSWSICPTCYTRLREEVALKNHRCHAGKIYNVRCKYCNQTFLSKKMMSGHKSMKHRNLKEDKISVPPLCSVCEKVFANNKYLRQNQLESTSRNRKRRRSFMLILFWILQESISFQPQFFQASRSIH